MSTQLAAFSDGTSASARNLTLGEQGTDPRRRRFGINPYIWTMVMPPRDAGQSQEVIASGLVTFRTDTIKVENYDDVLRVPEGEFQKEVYREHTAQWFLNNTKIRWAAQGFRELPSIMPLDDPDLNKDGTVNQRTFGHSAQGYFATVHPPIQCERDNAVEGCVTCRLRSLGTREDCPPELWAQMSRLPRPDVAEALRIELIEAYEARLAFCQNRWAELVGEVKKRERGEPGISFIDESGHYIRRHLHEIEPSDAATAASFGQQVGAQNAEGFKVLADAFREAKGDDTIAQTLKQMAENQARQDKILEALLKQQSSKEADAEAAE